MTGREVCLWLVKRLLEGYGEYEEITGILDSRVFYVLPCMNPYGAEFYLTTPYHRTGGGIQNPEWEWRPGLTEEDGEILKMRGRARAIGFSFTTVHLEVKKGKSPLLSL